MLTAASPSRPALITSCAPGHRTAGRKQVRVVTGVGKHSAGGQPRLLPAVKGWLGQQGLRFLEERGALLVTIEAANPV